MIFRQITLVTHLHDGVKVLQNLDLQAVFLEALSKEVPDLWEDSIGDIMLHEMRRVLQEKFLKVLPIF